MKNIWLFYVMLFGVIMSVGSFFYDGSQNLPGSVVESNNIETIIAAAKGTCQDSTAICAGASIRACTLSTVGLYCGGCTGNVHVTCQGNDENSCTEKYNQFCCSTNNTCNAIWRSMPTEENPNAGYYIYVCSNSSLPSRNYNTRILCEN